MEANLTQKQKSYQIFEKNSRCSQFFRKGKKITPLTVFQQGSRKDSNQGSTTIVTGVRNLCRLQTPMIVYTLLRFLVDLYLYCVPSSGPGFDVS